MAIEEDVGAQIRLERERAGLTQQELAARLGVDVKSVNNWETGRRAPRLSLARIHEVLTPVDARGSVGNDMAEQTPMSDLDDTVLMHVPPGATAGLSPAEREEAMSAARKAFLQTAREIRGARP